MTQTSTDLTIRVANGDADWHVVEFIRTEVFIIGQECPPEEEWDGFDDTSTHFLAEADGQPVGTARMRSYMLDGENVAKLERFAIRSAFRGRGFGKLLIQSVIDHALDEGFHTLYLHAQKHLENVYQGFGFETIGEPFTEAGILHVRMLRRSKS